MKLLHLQLAAVVLALAAAAPCLADAEDQDLIDDRHKASAAALPYPQPTVPADTTWAGAVMIVVGGMFVAAMVIGPIVRINAPEEVPAAHSHDEPPGASHHHGPGGTVYPGPEHELPGGHAHDDHH